jgi:hypothetical protein
MGRPPKQPDPLLGQDAGPLPLTRAERKFIRLYLEHGDVAKAAIEAGVYKSKGGKHPRIEAAKRGSAILRKAGPAITELMDQEGLSDRQLMDILKDGLSATECVKVRAGKDVDRIEQVTDFYTRLKYLEMGFKLRNAFPYRPAVIQTQGAAGKGEGVPIPVQHLDAIEKMPLEERKRELEKMIESAKRVTLRVVK